MLQPRSVSTARSKVTHFQTLKNTSPTLLLKLFQAIFCLAQQHELSAVSAGVGGDRAHHLAHLLSGDPASSIPRLPSPPAPPPETLLSCPSARGEPTAFRSHLKITPPHHKANKRRSRAAGLPWLLSGPPRPGIQSSSGPRASPAQASRRVPSSRPHNGPRLAPHLLCPGGHARAGGARPSTTPSTAAPSPGRTGQSGPPGLGVLGPASALALPPGEGTRTAPFPQSAPAGVGVRLQEKLVSGFAFRTKPAGPAHCSDRALAGSVQPADRGHPPELSRTPGRAAAHGGGGRARGAQTVRTGSLRLRGPRGTYRAAARCGARALSAARAAPLRTPAGPPTPPRFPPARPALAPSARLR